MRLELEGRLKAIDHEPQRLIDLAELIICLHSHQASTTHRLAHHGSILLFDMALIVLDRRTPPCEGQVLLLTVLNQFLVKELRTAIGINAEQKKGKRVRACPRAARTATALFSNRGMHSVQPVARSVSVKV